MSEFDKIMDKANDIGTTAKFDDAVKVADKTWDKLQKSKLNFSSKRR